MKEMKRLQKDDVSKALGVSVPDGKRALIVGAGKSGKAAKELLTSVGIECALYDDGEHDEWEDDRSGLRVNEVVEGIAFAIVSPSVPSAHPLIAELKRKGIAVFSELGLAAALCRARKIAVSGTNGKTTTVSLIEHILRSGGIDARAVGNIGVPFSAECADMPSYGVAVVEVSSFMLESGGIAADVAVLLNVTPDHLDRHGDFAEYARVKARLFEAQSGGDSAVFNADDAIAAAIADKVKSKAYFFSTRGKCRGAFVDGADICFDFGDGARRVCGSDCVKLVGEQNLSDCLAAVAACKLFGVGDEAIARGLESFHAPKYRLEYLCDYRNTSIFNDSKSTNIDCTISACEAMKGTTCLIVGGYDKKLSYHNFFSRLPGGVKYVVCCGDNSSRIIECAPENGDFEIYRTATLERAVMLGLSFDVDNLLFSPSTSSYDRYRNFEERGRHFEQAVRTFCA